MVVTPILLGSYLQSTFPKAVKLVTPFAPLVAVLASSLLACRLNVWGRLVQLVALDFVTIFHIKNAFHHFIYDLAENNSPKPNESSIFDVKVLLLPLSLTCFSYGYFSVYSLKMLFV